MSRASKENADLTFEKKLWQAADKMRNNMDAAEYKHVVLGLIFLKYISDAFIELYTKSPTPKELIQKTPMNIELTIYFMSPRKPAGNFYRRMPNSPPLAN